MGEKHIILLAVSRILRIAAGKSSEEAMARRCEKPTIPPTRQTGTKRRLWKC
jgi:hypothetical protein